MNNNYDSNYVKNCDKTYIKNCDKHCDKNYDCSRKKLSFLKITDPAKKNSIVKVDLETKKNFRNNLLNERTGEQQLQTALSKFFLNRLRKRKKLQ